MSNGREVYKKGTQGSVLLRGQLLFFCGHFSCCIKPQMSERNGGKTAEWAYGGMTQGASKRLAYPDISPLHDDKHVFTTLRTFLWYLPRINWRIVLPYKSILHCHGVSGKVLCSRNPKWYSIPYRIFFWSHKGGCGLFDFSNYGQIVGKATNVEFSNPKQYSILCRNSYDYTEVPAGYPTFSIAYLIYSTSH